jgi:predicted O-methyltransferase YrrM
VNGRPPEPESASVDEATERFINGLFAREDPGLERIREVMVREGLPNIQLPRITARTVQLLLRAVGARRVLEVGTLAGYSALWIVRALPEGGRLLTVEKDPARAELARRLLEEAGVGDRVEVMVGEARRLLADLEPEGDWDVVFLDADKEGLPGYVAEARRLLRPGGLLLVDNALWKGRVVDSRVRDEATESIRATVEGLAADPDFDALLLPVGDGLLVGIRGSGDEG